MFAVRVVVRGGKYFVGEPVKYFGRHNLVLWGREFYTADGLNLDFYRGSFAGKEVIIVRGHGIVCDGGGCTIGKWATFGREHLDDVVELLRRVESVEEHYENYFDNWWMTLTFGDLVVNLEIGGGVFLRDRSGTRVGVRDFLEGGARAFHVARVGEFEGWRVVSTTELENEWLRVQYTSGGTRVRFRDGVSRYWVELEGHLHPSWIEKKFPRVLFDVPPGVADEVYVPSFDRVVGSVDALPANGKVYRVGGVLGRYWGPDDWAVKKGGMLYYRNGEKFFVGREFGDVLVFVEGPSASEVKYLKSMGRPAVPVVPAEEVVYDLRRGVVHYYGVDCGDFRCNFRYWNGKFILSGLPLVDGLYDVVVDDWREFLKDDPRKVRGKLRPIGVWVNRDCVDVVWDGYVSQLGC